MSQKMLENLSDSGRAISLGANDGCRASLTQLSESLTFEDDTSSMTSGWRDPASSDKWWPPDESSPDLSLTLAKETTVVDRPAIYQSIYSTVHRGTRAGKLVAIRGTRSFRRDSTINYELEKVRCKWFLLDHKNVQRLLAVGNCAELSHYACTVSPWCEKGNISEFMKAGITHAQRVDLARGVASGIAYLHSLIAPLVHGSLHPANVLVDGNDRAVICGFDMTQGIRLELAQDMYTTIPINDTIPYIACERVKGNDSSEPTTESDIWSEACLLYEIVYSKLPYAHSERQGSTSCLELLPEINAGRPPAKSPSGLSKPAIQLWKTVLEPSWNVKPNKRPTAAFISQYLEGHDFPTASSG